MKERLLAMRPMLLRVLGYPAFFVFWFVVFVYVTFPYDRLRESIVAAVEAPRRSASGTLTPSDLQISIGDLGPTILPGVRARNVNLTSLPTKQGDHPITMHMDRVTAHVGLFALLAGNANVDVDIDGLGGHVDAHVEQTLRGTRPGLRELRATLDHVHAGDIAPLVALVGLPLSGTLGGTADIHIPDGHTEQASGAVHLTVDDLRIGDGHAQYQIPRFGGVTIEQIRAGRLEGNVNLHDGVATIERLGAHSSEFQFTMEGRVELRPVLAQSEMNATVRLQLTDAYRHKSERTGQLMLLMDNLPDLQAARRPDGLLGFRCRGPFDRMSCPPESRAGGAPSGRSNAALPIPSGRRFEPAAPAP